MAPQRILIADDDQKVVTLLTASLRKSGFVTFQALDGEDAWDKTKKEKPDLILADVTMPKLDGYQFCKMVREDPVTEHIPFIFLTAKGELNDRVTGLNMGADDYISKPFHISEVIARIKAILQRTTLTYREIDEEESESALKGDLEHMMLAEVLQTFTMTSKTGGLKIVNRGKTGEIYFENGEIVHASLEDLSSGEALNRILSWEEGTFEFAASDKPEKKTIHKGTTSLLMEGFEQRDEFLKYKDLMPAFEAVVKIPDPAKLKGAKPNVQKIVDLIDGDRTIQDVIDVSRQNYVFTTKVLYTLLKKELLKASEMIEHRVMDEDFGELASELYG